VTDVMVLIGDCMMAMTSLLTTLSWLFALSHGTLMLGIMPPIWLNVCQFG